MENGENHTSKGNIGLLKDNWAENQECGYQTGKCWRPDL